MVISQLPRFQIVVLLSRHIHGQMQFLLHFQQQSLKQQIFQRSKETDGSDWLEKQQFSINQYITEICIQDPFKIYSSINILMKKTIFFSFFLLTILASPLCPGSNPTDLIQTGSVTLERQALENSDSCYTININYKVPDSGFQIALSLVDANLIDQSYSVKGIKQSSKTSFGVVVITPNKIWKKISVSYLVSSRPDLAIGSILLDPYSDYTCGEQLYDHKISTSVMNMKPQKKYQGHLFISGLEAIDTKFDLTLQLSQIKADKIVIRVKTDAIPLISIIQVTYILRTNEFPFVTQLKNLANSFDDYAFQGISEYKSGIVSQSLIFNSQKLFCEGSKCKDQCITNIGCQLLKGEIAERICYACNEGEKYLNKKCSTICKESQTFQNGKCQKPTCPKGSYWNKMLLQCFCFNPDEHVIEGNCQQCPIGEQWDLLTKQCVCSQGKVRLGGGCGTCKLNQVYNSNEKSCQCNYGFYRNFDGLCSTCHPSCGRCTGSYENQCTQCSDVSYTFSNGKCHREDPCPKGLFLEDSHCMPCSAYCQRCSSEAICETCIEGFTKTELNFGGVRATYCVQICGDGKRFQYECDDGNQKNGDGCNQNCEVEKQWTCLGGTTIKPSECTREKPNKTEISLTGTVHLLGRIVQGVRLSYLPPELTANDCALCSKILWVRVISSVIVPGVRVNFMPKSKYQFLVEFQFNGLFAVPIFTISVQINPEFKQFFTGRDLAQLQVKQIDPSTLKISFIEETLSLDEPPADAIEGANQLANKVFN